LSLSKAQFSGARLQAHLRRILIETIKDPIGADFMAPPDRVTA